MKAMIYSITPFVLVCTFTWSAHTFGQDNGWTGGVGGNWTDNTWEFGDPPLPEFDVRGIIGSTAGSNSPVAEVQVSTDISATNPSPTVVLGNGATTSGTLTIAPAGHLAVVTGTAGSTGTLSVGANGGLGILNVEGTLQVEGRLESLNSGDGGSTVTLSGLANVTSGDGFLDRQLVIDGSNVNASFSNDLVLGSVGTHTWKIPASGASTLFVGGNADLGGTLKVEFPDGAPAMGSTWNLIDSTTVDAGESSATGFSRIDQSAVTGLATGATFAVTPVADPGSSHGVYTQLALEQHPVLVIDRSTGATSIRNFSSSMPTVDFDAYTIGSAGGYWNTAAWTSMAPANGWVVANPSSIALSELNTATSTSVAVASSIALGTPFMAPASFGEENENVTFRFARPNANTFTDGRVLYTGASNSTLTLHVDPATGQAQLVNGTAFTVSIDSYVITSASDSLEPSNGSWNSLEDQGSSAGNWFESNVSTGQLAELLVTGGMVLSPNAVVPLGAPFDEIAGVEDLVFQFARIGDEQGDFDGDGDRDGFDFLKWQRGESPSPWSVSDLANWQAGFGIPTTSGADDLLTGKVWYGPLGNLDGGTLAAVPEPGTAGLLGLSLAILFVARRKRLGS